MPIREHMSVADELRDIIIADIVLILAFSLTLVGGIFGLFSNRGSFISNFLIVLPVVAVGVTLSFILHELMHKFVAQRYGAIAGFRTNPIFLLITFATGAAGFLLGMPGATMIYVQSFTKKENGIVSLAGPATNLVIFAITIAVFYYMSPAANSYLANALGFIIFINLFLAFFNMLPIYPLDGSKVIAWNMPIYAAVMGAIIILLVLFTAISITYIVYLLVIAIALSFFYRGIFR